MYFGCILLGWEFAHSLIAHSLIAHSLSSLRKPMSEFPALVFWQQTCNSERSGLVFGTE